MTTFRTIKFRCVLLSVLAVGGVALAACSSTPNHPSSAGHSGTTDHLGATNSSTTSAPTTSTTGSSSTATTVNAAGPQCSFNDLTVSFGSPDGAAGHTYYALDFLNTGAAPCTLFGFPGVSFVDAANTTIGSVTAREGNETPGKVTLAPGGFAVAPLAVTDPGIPPCAGSANASFVRVYPPGSFSAYSIPVTNVSVCSSPSTAGYQDSSVAAVAAATPSNVGPGPYDACDKLDMSIGQGGAGLGHISEPILFRNAGTTTCTMYGYPSVIVSANGATSGVDDTPNGYLGGASGSTVPDVTLAPGATASALIEGTDSPEGNATSCPTFNSVQVSPPGDSQSVTLDTSLPGCSTIEVHPVVNGSTGTQS
jgi:Protein of unknown function (DUF4232)